MEQKPILTISLLSSGRSGTIERCLSSLAPFKEQISTEIIIVDTDPDHNGEVFALLEKYADQIIPFEWCDDFAAARNVGVDAASGQWFLFLDDDEWFIDPQPFIDFIQSDNLEGYTSALQKIRNYTSADYSDYLDSWGERLFSLKDKGRFNGRIHEWFVQKKDKPVRLEALSGHTGYLYLNDEQREAHVKRNLTVLEEMMEREPREVRWPLHALFEYHAMHRTDKEVEVSLHIYKMIEGQKRYDLACVRGYVCANILRVLQIDERYSESYRYYKRFIKKLNELGLYSRAYMEIFAAVAAYRMGKTKQAKKHALKYLNYYDRYADKPLKRIEEQYDFLMNTFSQREHAYGLTWLVDIDIEEGDWDSFEKYFGEIIWDGTGKYDETVYARLMLASGTRTEYDSHLADMVCEFWKHPKTLAVIQTALLAWDPTIGHNDAAAAKAREEMNAKINDVTTSVIRSSYESGKESRTGEGHESFDTIRMRYTNLVRAITEADIEKGTPLDIYIIWDDINGKRENMPGYYMRLFANTNPLLLDIKLWKIGVRRGAVLDERIREISYRTWQDYVIEFISNSTIADITKMTATLNEVYLGMSDEYYAFYRQQTDRVLAMAEEAKRQTTREEKNTAVQAEMKQILEVLEKKVEELIAAGMMDEAEQVMAEIRKYGPV